MVSFQMISDLHLEMGGKEAYEKHDIVPRAPYLALLGDIGVANADHGHAYLAFLRRHLLRFRVVFLVMGNHEAYRSTWTETRALLRGFEADIRAEREAAPQASVSSREAGHEGQGTLGEFVLLDRDSYTIQTSRPGISTGIDGSTAAEGEDDTVTVLGCTLFSHLPIHAAERVGRGLADFSMISDGWNVPQHNAAFRRDVAWLNEQVAQLSSSSSSSMSPARATTQSDINQVSTNGDETTKTTISSNNNNKVVIFTHHCPTLDDRATEPRHKGSLLSSGFCSDLSDQPCITTNIAQLADSNQSSDSAAARFKQRLAGMSQFLPFRRGADGDLAGGDDGDNIVRCQQSAPSGIVKLWAFGHTHYNCNFVNDGKGKSGIRLYNNQRGYSFQQSRGYNEDRVVQL